MKPTPVRIEPIFSPRIWGARSLAPLFPEKSNLAEPIGEAWLTGIDSRVGCGPFSGKTLGEAWQEMPAEWCGSQFARGSNFPLLLKFIFPEDKLSIQVHPDDAYASVHEAAAGGRGKTEMWHVVSAEPGAQLLLGLKPEVDRPQFLEALKNGTVDSLFQSCPVRAGDTIFLPAGTPHSIGPGMLVCEIQEYSDLTYRLYDYGRVDGNGKPRELHLDKALAVMKFGKAHGGKVEPVPLPAEGANRFLLAGCRYFATERWEFCATVQTHSVPRRFELFVILSGTGYIHSHVPAVSYGPGECWLIPASLGEFSLQPEQSSAVIRAFVPDLTDLSSELQGMGLKQQQLERVLFPD